MAALTEVEIVPAHTEDKIPAVRELFQEYADWLDYDLCLQSFDEELAGLPGAYAPPSGRLYLVIENHEIAGCVALRKLSEKVGEMKRLYLRPHHRGSGVGRLMAQRIIDDARAIGYQTLRLDTIPQMQAAIQLYHSLGFREIAPPPGAPMAGEIYMEMSLRR